MVSTAWTAPTIFFLNHRHLISHSVLCLDCLDTRLQLGWRPAPEPRLTAAYLRIAIALRDSRWQEAITIQEAGKKGSHIQSAFKRPVIAVCDRHSGRPRDVSSAQLALAEQVHYLEVERGPGLLRDQGGKRVVGRHVRCDQVGPRPLAAPSRRKTSAA